ncbi:type VI secretion system contractile sheath large subunit [Sorangium sp. So ce327]
MGECSRALGLALPRLLLRAPFGRGERAEASFAYEESTEDHESYLQLGARRASGDLEA